MIEVQRDFFNTPEGKDLLAYWCQEAYIFKSTFVVGNPERTLLNEGSRLFVLSILKDLGIDLDQLRQMSERNLTNEAYTS